MSHVLSIRSGLSLDKVSLAASVRSESDSGLTLAVANRTKLNQKMVSYEEFPSCADSGYRLDRGDMR